MFRHPIHISAEQETHKKANRSSAIGKLFRMFRFSRNSLRYGKRTIAHKKHVCKSKQKGLEHTTEHIEMPERLLRNIRTNYTFRKFLRKSLFFSFPPLAFSGTYIIITDKYRKRQKIAGRIPACRLQWKKKRRPENGASLRRKWYDFRRFAATYTYRISTHKRRIPACRFPEPEHSAICMKFH